MYPNPFKPLFSITSAGRFNTAPLTVAATTTASGTLALPGSATEDVNCDIRIENQTTGFIYVTFGDVNVPAATATNGIGFAPNSVEIVEMDKVAGYCSVLATVAGTVRLTRGQGI